MPFPIAQFCWHLPPLPVLELIFVWFGHKCLICNTELSVLPSHLQPAPGSGCHCSSDRANTNVASFKTFWQFHFIYPEKSHVSWRYWDFFSADFTFSVEEHRWPGARDAALCSYFLTEPWPDSALVFRTFERNNFDCLEAGLFWNYSIVAWCRAGHARGSGNFCCK